MDAFFEVVSGLTTTGATILTDVEGLSRGLLFWRSLTHWLGGMGIIVLYLALLPALGPQCLSALQGRGPRDHCGTDSTPHQRDRQDPLDGLFFVESLARDALSPGRGNAAL